MEYPQQVYSRCKAPCIDLVSEQTREAPQFLLIHSSTHHVRDLDRCIRRIRKIEAQHELTVVDMIHRQPDILIGILAGRRERNGIGSQDTSRSLIIYLGVIDPRIGGLYLLSRRIHKQAVIQKPLIIS